MQNIANLSTLVVPCSVSKCISPIILGKLLLPFVLTVLHTCKVVKVFKEVIGSFPHSLFTKALTAIKNSLSCLNSCLSLNVSIIFFHLPSVCPII